jgi:dipeptidyl aminopeptidase/acylaminoacyl peptidase
VDNRDAAAFDALVAALSPATRRLLERLSPEAAVAGSGPPLFLVHGRSDPAVPFTETLRLARAAQAAGRPARALLVGAVGHVDPAERATAWDLVRLALDFYAFRVTSAGRAP